MPFKDTKEGQTHYYGDHCGEPEHNSMENKKTKEERFYGEALSPFENNVFSPQETNENL